VWPGDVEQKHFRFGKGGRRGYLRRPMIEASSLQFGPRDSKQTIEEGLAFAPKFDEHGLIAAMAVDADTNEPLMLAYMNAETLRETLALGQAVYYSRSRKGRWHKGLTSGEFQDVIEIRTDCDQDALILRVKQRGGGCCHTSRPTCFYRKVAMPAEAGVVMLEKA
jgi:phosphoribosyl-AMP cyclohydrolase